MSQRGVLSPGVCDAGSRYTRYAVTLRVVGAIGFDVGRETLCACRGAEHLVNPAANHIVANNDNYALAA